MRFTLVAQNFKKVGELTKKYSNLPDSYIKRSMEQIYYRTPNKPNYRRSSEGRKTIKFTEHRPWTLESRLENPLHKRTPKIYVEPIRHWTVFKGDRVEILDGKDKGKQGVVSMVIQERNWVIVNQCNTKMKVIKKEGDRPALVNREEQPLRVTDQVALVDPSDMLPCKVEWRFTEKGERVRVSVRTGRIIPMPRMAEETYDYKSKNTYEEKDKDTVATVVAQVTFEPTLCTFEMDIMNKMGIEENRIPAPVYWY